MQLFPFLKHFQHHGHYGALILSLPYNKHKADCEDLLAYLKKENPFINEDLLNSEGCIPSNWQFLIESLYMKEIKPQPLVLNVTLFLYFEPKSLIPNEACISFVLSRG